jgi:dipeptidyl aminopeptidase B
MVSTLGGRRYLSTDYSHDVVINGPMQEFPTVRGLLLALAALVTLSAAIGLFAALSYKDTNRAIPSSQRITMNHIFNDTFAVERTGLSWVPEGVPRPIILVVVELTVCSFTQAGDGVFSRYQDGYIKLVNLNSNTSTNLVQLSDLKDVSLANDVAFVALDHFHIVGARKWAGLVQLEALT